MAAPVSSSSMFMRRAKAFRLLALRSDVDSIILELLGQFSLERIYAEADKDTYQSLVTALLAQLNAIYNIQRLTLPSESLQGQVGWYLGFLASGEVTLRTIEFVLQVVVDGRDSLWEARLLRDKYLPELLLNALRFVTLHPKTPSNQRAKDKRDRFARVHRCLERLFDSYPGPEAFLLLVCKEFTDALRKEPNGPALPSRLKVELPNLALDLYPLAECLTSRYVATIVPQDGFPRDWLAQVLALRDVSQFVVGASVQYTVNRETRDIPLQSSSARTRTAVLRALESIQMPQHLSQLDLLASFSDTFRTVLPDTLHLGQRKGAEDSLDESEIDALDALCSRLEDRQVIQRISDREMMHGISKITRNIELADDPTGQFGATRPRLFTVNCSKCHEVGHSQLRALTNQTFPLDNDMREVTLPWTSKCAVCGEDVTMMREIQLARYTWEILKPLEANANTINVERHLPSQFQMSPPKPDTGIPFHAGYGSILSGGRHRSHDAEVILSPISARTGFSASLSISPDQSRSIPQALLMSPSSPGFQQRLDSPRNDYSTAEDYLTSSDGPTNTENSMTSDSLKATTSAESQPLAVAAHSPQLSSGNVAIASSSRVESVSSVSFEPTPSSRSQTLPTIPAPDKGKSFFGLRSKLTATRKESTRSSGDSSSLSSTTVESQKLEEISLKKLTSASKSSTRGKSAKNINVYLSQNSTYVLFWTQLAIDIWDIGGSSPILGRTEIPESNCVLAAVTKVHLAYIVGTRDQKLTLCIVNLLDTSAPPLKYRMPSSPWCHSITISPSEEYVVVGFSQSLIRWYPTAIAPPNASTSPFTPASSQQPPTPRVFRLHMRSHRDCSSCPPVATLSFSPDSLVLLVSTRSSKNGMIQVYKFLFPFDDFSELASCRYHVPLHESEDNGVSSAIFRSNIHVQDHLICIGTWTQSGLPLLINPNDGHRTEIRTDSSSHQGKLGSRIQSAAFSSSGRELAMVNDKGYLYLISNLNSNPLEVKRVATSKAFTTKSEGFSMQWTSLDGEEAIVLAWADGGKGTGYVKKIVVKWNDTPNTPVPMTSGALHGPGRYELPSEGREVPRPPVEVEDTDVGPPPPFAPPPLNVTKEAGYPREKA